MQNIEQHHVQAQKHSRRVYIYRIILFYLALAIIIIFAASLAYPYLQKMQIQPKEIKKSLLGRMEAASLMITPKIVSYKNGREIYSIKADETEQDYANSRLLHLKNIKASFAISDKAKLYLESVKADFYIQDKILNLPVSINMKLIEDGKITTIKLANATIDIKAAKLSSQGLVQLYNRDLSLQANNLLINNKGMDLLFDKKVLVTLKDDVRIEAQQLAIHRLQQQLIWRHKVVVTKGADILKSDKLVANYEMKGAKTIYNSLKNLRAYDNVYLKQNNDIALACEADFNSQTNKFILKKCADSKQTTVFF